MLVDVADREVSKHEAIGAVGADADVLAPTAGPWFPFAGLPASTTTSSALTPEPSIWKLQRMQRPRLGMLWRSSSGGCGSVPVPSEWPITAIRFWSLGQWNW